MTANSSTPVATAIAGGGRELDQLDGSIGPEDTKFATTAQAEPANGVAIASHFETRSKKGRGMAQRSLDLIEAMYDAAEAAQPITGRGIGYKLFTAGLIPSMARSEMQRVYRLLKEARERGDIPWEWIVDETRELERVSTWANPAAYARAVAKSYRRDFWDQQPVRCEVWSEKGTVRGVLDPVLKDYAVGFRVMHGFSGGELDAMDPNDLRACVKNAIVDLIEPVAWRRCEIVNEAEQASLKSILSAWRAP